MHGSPTTYATGVWILAKCWNAVQLVSRTESAVEPQAPRNSCSRSIGTASAST